MSVSQFSELMGIEPRQFVGVEVNRRSSTVTLVVEGSYADNRDISAASRQHEARTEERREAMSYGKHGGSGKTPKGGGPKKA